MDTLPGRQIWFSVCHCNFAREKLCTDLITARATRKHLPSGHPIMQANSSCNSVGVGVFVADNYAVNIGKNDLNSNCEDIWMQIIDNITKNAFILVVVYRHPGGNVNSFITSFNEKFLLLNSTSRSRFYIAGYFNINANPNNISDSSNNYLNMLSSNGAYMLINIPTRVSGESKTTIDHVTTNDIHNVIYPCVFLNDISDHMPVACLVASAPKSSTGMFKNNSTKENYIYRDTSHFDPDQGVLFSLATT